MYEQTHSSTASASQNSATGLIKFFRQTKKFWWIPVALTFLMGIVGFLLASITDSPTYTSKMLMSINLTISQNGDLHQQRYGAGAMVWGMLPGWFITSNTIADKVRDYSAGGKPGSGTAGHQGLHFPSAEGVYQYD